MDYKQALKELQDSMRLHGSLPGHPYAFVKAEALRVVLSAHTQALDTIKCLLWNGIDAHSDRNLCKFGCIHSDGADSCIKPGMCCKPEWRGPKQEASNAKTT
jgi:hypothetical protein